MTPSITNYKYNEFFRGVVTNYWIMGGSDHPVAILFLYIDTICRVSELTKCEADLDKTFPGYFIYEAYCDTHMETLPTKNNILVWANLAGSTEMDRLLVQEWLSELPDNLFYPEGKTA